MKWSSEGNRYCDFEAGALFVFQLGIELFGGGCLMECRVCGKAHDPDDQFCSKCGTPLAEEQPLGRFRPLFQKTQDPSSAFASYVRPFLIAGLLFCLGLVAVAGIISLIGNLLSSK
jgi:hypothetical protein